MAITRVNSASITARAAAASATATIPGGTGIQAGDLIFVCAASSGTHVANTMSVQDSVNLTPFTKILETQPPGSAFWQSTHVFQTPVSIADGSTITLTGFAAATACALAIDIFRGASAVIDRAAVGAGNATTTTPAGPALGGNATAGALVLTTCSTGATGTTQAAGSPFTAGSTQAVSPGTGIGFVLSASGSLTYGSTWTLGVTSVSATQTVSFLPAAAPAAVRPVPAPSRPRPQSRARTGARGLCAAGVLASGIAAQPGTAVPPPQPRPVIAHPAPHRATWRLVTGQAYVAVPPPRQRPPQPRTPAPHAALWRGRAVAPRLPQGPSRLPLPLRRPGPHRAITGGVRGPQPTAFTGVAVAPPGWHPQPRYVPVHRVTWRAVAGLPAPPQTVTTPPPRQLPQVPRRTPARALWKVRAVPPRVSTLPVPHPAAIPRQAPHRVIWRLVTGQAPAAGIAVRAPGLIPQPRHLPAARGIWRRLAGPGNAPPPPFTVGALTASGAPASTLTAAGASSALTASTAPSGTLTAATVAGNALELFPVQAEDLGELFDEAGGQIGA